MSAEIETIHKPLLKHLRERGIEFIYSASFKATTVEVGWPDFSILHPHRGALLIEAKDKDTPISKDQKIVHARLAVRGFRVHIVRSIEAATDLVNEWFAQAPAPTPLLPRSESSPYIADRGHGLGDWVFEGAKPVRRATIADLKSYPRK